MGWLSDEWRNFKGNVRTETEGFKRNKEKWALAAAAAGGAYYLWPYISGASAAGAASGGSAAGSVAGTTAAGGAASAGTTAASTGGFWGNLASGAGIAAGGAIGGALTAPVAQYAGDKVSGALGYPVTPYERGQAERQYYDGAYPGTNPWERLSGNSPQAGFLQSAREQRQHEQTMQARDILSKQTIAKAQIQGQQNVAKTGALGSIASSGEWNPQDVSSFSDLLDGKNYGFAGVSNKTHQAQAALSQASSAARNADTNRRNQAVNEIVSVGQLDLNRTRDRREAILAIQQGLTTLMPRNAWDIPGDMWRQRFNEAELEYWSKLGAEVLIGSDPNLAKLIASVEQGTGMTDSPHVPGDSRSVYDGLSGADKFGKVLQMTFKEFMDYAEVVGIAVGTIGAGYALFTRFKAALNLTRMQAARTKQTAQERHKQNIDEIMREDKGMGMDPNEGLWPSR